MGDADKEATNEGGFVADLIDELTSPLHLCLIAVIAYLFYKIVKGRQTTPTQSEPERPPLPKLRRDFTLQELKKYDGTQEDGRVLVAVNGNVYDCTKGRRFYGPGGNYAVFGGRDASRGLATFSLSTTDEYDDLSDLSPMDMESVREWDTQFKEKYEWVGRLLKPGEEPTNYSDEEDEANATGDAGKPKDEDTGAKAKDD